MYSEVAKLEKNKNKRKLVKIIKFSCHRISAIVTGRQETGGFGIFRELIMRERPVGLSYQ